MGVTEVSEQRFKAGVAACSAAVAAFLLLRLTAWPPHEDETLALYVGHGSLESLGETVLGERGGAPLHFLAAWVVAHLGGGLTALRLVSAVFAVASVPLVAALGLRLADRTTAVLATWLASASWILIFHGVYARMYSLFLFTSALSYLLLLRALERGGKAAWARARGGARVRGRRRARDPVLADRPRARGPLRRRRRRRRREARRPAPRAPVPRRRGGRLQRPPVVAARRAHARGGRRVADR